MGGSLPRGGAQHQVRHPSHRPNDFALNYFDVVAAYAMVNKSASTWVPMNVTVNMSSPLSASDGVYVEGGNKTWHVAHWTQDAADWMR